MRHTLALGPLIGVVLLATACGSGPTASSDAMSPEALARQFGACNLPDAGPVYSIMSDLTGTKRWLQVIEVPAEAIPTTAPGWDQDWDLATPQVVVLEDGVRRTERLRIHASFLTVVPWAERNDAGVWFAMATADSGAGEDTVAYPIVVLPTGDGFIPGQCMDLVYDQRMQKEYGADWALLLGRLPGTTKAEAREILGVPEPSSEPSHEAVLEPGTNRTKNLDYIGVRVEPVQRLVDDSGKPLTICTHIDAGWSDCFHTDGDQTPDLSVNAFVDESRTLQFWLLGNDADITAPLGQLGAIQVPETGPDGTALTNVRVSIDLTGLDPATLTEKPANRVLLKE